MDLMWEHHLLDNEPTPEVHTVTSAESEEPEHYYDPSFEEEWNNLESEELIDNIISPSRNIPLDLNKKDWEEVL